MPDNKAQNEKYKDQGPGTSVTKLTPASSTAPALKGFKTDASGQSQSENRGKDGGR